MSNDTVKGTIESVKDDGGSKGKFGFQYKLGICIDGEWYGGWTKKSAEDLGIEDGRTVSFEFTENGQYKNFVEKTIKVSKATAEAPAAAGKATPAKVDYQVGVKVGHAINNAVQIACAAGYAEDLERIGKLAIGIINLGQRLEAAFPSIIAKSQATAKAAAPAPAAKPATKRAAPAPVEPEEEEEQEEEAPPPPPKAKAKAAVNKAAPAPVVAEDDGQFDDDIPF